MLGHADAAGRRARMRNQQLCLTLLEKPHVYADTDGSWLKLDRGATVSFPGDRPERYISIVIGSQTLRRCPK
jgi:hypothetical protein